MRKAFLRRWFALLFVVLLVVSDGLPMALAAGFSLNITSDCLSCELVDKFPTLKPQLEGEANWQSTIRQVNGRKVKGLQATLGQSQLPTGLKLQEQQAWVAVASREQMKLFAPARYTEPFVVEQGQVRVELEAIGAKPAPLQQQNKNLIYRNIYHQTDSLQVIQGGRSEEFLYLRDKSAPTVFEYRLRTSAGVRVKTEGTTVVFRNSRGQGVRIDSPYLVDQSGQRNASAVKWQVLDGGQKLRLVVTPQGLSYPLVVDPAWSSTGSMNTARGYHTATLLPNGKVLVAGGSNGNSLSSAEVYDPITGTWTSTGSMNTARGYHTATLLLNGKVLVVAGYDGSNLNSAELYDPATGTWTSTGSLSIGRRYHTATLLANGNVLVAGGENLGSLNSVELYDPTTGIWSNTGSMNTARQFHTATLLPNGKVLVAGGSSSAELYDPTTGSWTSTGSMITGRANHTATLLPNGKVLVAGGSSLRSAELYDPTTGSWTSTGSMITARSSHIATLLTNGKVLIAGGISIPDYRSVVVSSAEVYDPATGIWSSTASMSTARTYYPATLLPNGKVLVAGGFNNFFPYYFNSAELYDVGVPVIGLTPTSGPVGTAVIITGANFIGTTGVTFNGLAATSFSIDSANQITAIVPTDAISGQISVFTPGGTFTTATSFTVMAAPTISSFTPTSGPVGATVIITGTNLTFATTVKFNGISATNFTVNSATQITATVPPSANTGNIMVTTLGGTATSTTSFTVTLPVLTSFSPLRGNFGTTVILTGTNFTSTSSVKFNGLSAAFTVNSASQITATVPAGAISGLIQVVTSSGTATSTTFIVNPVAVRTLGWQQSGAGDFNGDGKPDLLWRNYTTGVNRVWFMNGTAFLGQADFIPVTDTNWQLVGAADFTNDGKPDLLWRNFSTGRNSVWQMNGITYVQSFDLGAVTDPNWQLAAIGDLTNDGKPDLIWRNYGTGDIYVWKMDGYTYQQAFFIGNVADPYWQLAGTGDLTNDGKPDLLWRYWGPGAGSGDVYLWKMDGYTYQTFAFIATVTDLNYQLTGIGDFTGDGQRDLVWSNNSNGDNYVWRMNGYTYQQAIFIGPTPTP